MSNRMERFKRVVSTGAREDHTPKREPGPFPGHPSVQLEDAKHIAGIMTSSKWSDVVYEGPGADAANKRRDESLGRSVKAVKAPAGAGSWWSRLKRRFGR
jgi:hypothetical protein